MNIIELLTPAYEAAWLPWAVQYFFLIGIAATAGLLAGWLAFGSPGSDRARLLPATVVVLLVTGIAAPVSLLADLHQPGRFWHFYAYPTPWSWMSIGAFLLPVYVTLVMLFSASWWLRKLSWMRAIGVLMILSALTILTYTGGEMMVVRSRPLWATPFLPVNLALTGALGTLGAVLLVARWLPGGLKGFPIGLLRRLAQLVSLALAAAALAWALLGVLGHSPSFTEAMKLFTEFGAWKLALIGSLIVGLAVMALIWRPLGSHPSNAYGLVVALALLGAAWVFRWIVFMAVQTVPKFGAGLYLQSLPWGSDGVLGMVGVFGLVAALIAIVSTALYHFPPRVTLAAA
ncbi:tetrathionate reductase [Ottowia sp. GY511]|uniref:NrfD/PsrC family molybdoenzyme membrane anchor subunit n=1 Tax=Ottowia flava TaxID=2675430 RepID=A0ABW4KUE3_9BURK|nr:NrfD/PsrC family molybdoenzyme membrane anchor subunit [Ottowia sp. GY511]TXK23559.1 tetrathionate reductase [Ottowia sp. GY511]